MAGVSDVGFDDAVGDDLVAVAGDPAHVARLGQVVDDGVRGEGHVRSGGHTHLAKGRARGARRALVLDEGVGDEDGAVGEIEAALKTPQVMPLPSWDGGVLFVFDASSTVICCKVRVTPFVASSKTEPGLAGRKVTWPSPTSVTSLLIV